MTDTLKHAQKFVKQLAQRLEQGEKCTEKDLAQMKNEFSAEHSIPNLRNIDLIEAYRELTSAGFLDTDKELERVIARRKIRSQSGVGVITCMTKPMGCPGKCIYCPSEPNMPKSYLSNQPAAMRAVLNKFDAFNQTQNRLGSLMITGHDTSKIEIIVNGGTWGALPHSYQEEFIAGIYNGLNQDIKAEEIESTAQFFKVPKIERREDLPLDEAVKKNEEAKHRCVGLTLETRPDWVNEDEIKRFRRYGATRIEMGVQSLDDHVQEVTKRGHNIDAVRNATKLLRDAGYKIGYHLMPGLPGSTPEIDIEAVRQTFNDADFCPDWVKFYPCMVTKFSDLEKIYLEGNYKPLNDKDLVPILIEMMKIVPRYARVTRMIRDIPSESVVAGCKTINLRQIVEKKMEEENITCNDIRAREIKSDELNIRNVEMRRLNYKANEGDEMFLSFDEKVKDKLVSMLRLRIPSQYFTKEKHWMEELEGCALIREVHTYGMHTRVGSDAKDGNSQHYGFGRQLVAEAERIAKEEYGMKRIAVIAGVGVRKYYEKFGYKLAETYMIKEL